MTAAMPLQTGSGILVQGLKVLVCDDDPELALAVKSLLERRFGFKRISVTYDGTLAIGELQLAVDRGVYFDMVICDWNMPRCTGLELLQWMRSRASLAATPFVFLTAVAEEHMVRAAIAIGASDYVMKPLSEAVFTRKIGALIEKL